MLGDRNPIVSTMQRMIVAPAMNAPNSRTDLLSQLAHPGNTITGCANLGYLADGSILDSSMNGVGTTFDPLDKPIVDSVSVFCNYADGMVIQPFQLQMFLANADLISELPAPLFTTPLQYALIPTLNTEYPIKRFLSKVTFPGAVGAALPVGYGTGAVSKNYALFALVGISAETIGIDPAYNSAMLPYYTIKVRCLHSKPLTGLV